MKPTPSKIATRAPGTTAPVDFCGRDSFWGARHFAEVKERVARKKWQCLSCGECGFAETTCGEKVIEVARRIGHRCPPENITFYSPGASEPLAD